MDATNNYPSHEWRAAFRQESTPQTMQAAVRCATIELARLERLDIFPSWDAEDLVQRILAATCAGNLAWNPDKATLRAHLRDKIRLVCRRMRRRCRPELAATVVALDEIGDDDPVWAERELSTNSVSTDFAIAELARRVEAEMWMLAANDPVALRVLSAMSAGEGSNVELAQMIGLPVEAIAAAKKRLQRLGTQVSPALLADIRAELHMDTPCDDLALERSDDGLD